ncbi:MAG: hypothetical protein IKR73_07030 [Oscillospiraceae bacterium]|nr:hypothetical protein [Oscillospiraceae bacterium]
MIFLIDHENVTSAGLDGVEDLTENDKVYIFYSDAQQTITFDAHRAIMQSKAQFTYFLVANGHANALDFQLTSFVGYLVGRSDDRKIYIISKDKGFTVIWKFWEAAAIDGLGIYCCPSISKALARAREIRADRIASDAEPRVGLDELGRLPSDKSAKRSAQSDKSAAAPVAAQPAAAPVEAPVTEPVSPEAAIPTAPAVSAEPVETAPVTEPAPVKEAPEKSSSKKAAPAKEHTPTERSIPYKALLKNIEDLLQGTIQTSGFDKVIEVLGEAKDKQSFYTGMTKVFGMEQGLAAYKILRPEYMGLKRQAEGL